MTQSITWKRYIYVLATGLDSTEVTGGVVIARDEDHARAIVARYEDLLYDEDATDEDAEQTDYDEDKPLTAHEEDLLEHNLDECQGVLAIGEIPQVIDSIVAIRHASNG